MKILEQASFLNSYYIHFIHLLIHICMKLFDSQFVCMSISTIPVCLASCTGKSGFTIFVCLALCVNLFLSNFRYLSFQLICCQFVALFYPLLEFLSVKQFVCQFGFWSNFTASLSRRLSNCMSGVCSVCLNFKTCQPKLP